MDGRKGCYRADGAEGKREGCGGRRIVERKFYFEQCVNNGFWQI